MKFEKPIPIGKHDAMIAAVKTSVKPGMNIRIISNERDHKSIVDRLLSELKGNIMTHKKVRGYVITELVEKWRIEIISPEIDKRLLEGSYSLYFVDEPCKLTKEQFVKFASRSWNQTNIKEGLFSHWLTDKYKSRVLGEFD